MADQVKVVFSGNAKLPTLTGPLRNVLSQVVRKTAFDAEALAKDAIQSGPKTGRIYRAEQEVSFQTREGEEVSFTAYKGEQGHQASAPGEAPATDTGNLVNSIQVKVSGDLQAEIVVSAEYAAALEFGGTHVEPRPFLQPAVEAVAPAFEAALDAVLEKAFGGA